MAESLLSVSTPSKQYLRIFDLAKTGRHIKIQSLFSKKIVRLHYRNQSVISVREVILGVYFQNYYKTPGKHKVVTPQIILTSKQVMW
jgi:hypothetical protein